MPLSYGEAALTEEQIVEIAEKRATTNRGMRVVINRLIGEQCMAREEFESAKRYVSKLERANGEMSPLEYCYAVEHKIGELVNSKY